MTMAMNTPKTAGNQEPIQRWRPIRRMAPASMSPAATLSAATGAMKFHSYGSSLFCNSQDISGMHTAPRLKRRPCSRRRTASHMDLLLWATACDVTPIEWRQIVIPALSKKAGLVGKLPQGRQGVLYGQNAQP